MPHILALTQLYPYKQLRHKVARLNKYQNLSQDELMTELFKEARRLKQNGSLNENSLNMLQNTLAPMLNNEQNKQLKDILNRIK